MKSRRKYKHTAKARTRLGRENRVALTKRFRSMGWSVGIWWEEEHSEYCEAKISMRSDSSAVPPMPSGDYTTKKHKVV